MSRQVSRGSAGEYQADEQAVSRGSAGEDQADEQASSRKKVRYMKDTSTSQLPPNCRCSSTVSLPPEKACLLTCTRRGHTDARQAAPCVVRGARKPPFPVEPGDWPLRGSLQRRGL